MTSNVRYVHRQTKELRFIFTSPTFTTEKTPKQQREFYIPRLDRERTLYGSEFEQTLDEQIEAKIQREKLLKQIETLERQCRAEKQTRKKFELHQQLLKLKEQL